MMKKFISLLLALVMALSLMACGNNADANNDAANDDQPPAETVELTVFAAVSLTESLTAIGEKDMAENVKINFNFDSSGKLYTQIKEGAYSASLTVAAEATADMCGQVIYPAAVLNTSAQQDAAAAFLAYLQTAEASAEFEKVLFTP